jgi:transcriptional regulator with XRE-family HTH domain
MHIKQTRMHIKQTRESLGLTQEKLAEICNLSRRTINELENSDTETNSRIAVVAILSKLKIKRQMEELAELNGNIPIPSGIFDIHDHRNTIGTITTTCNMEYFDVQYMQSANRFVPALRGVFMKDINKFEQELEYVKAIINTLNQ